MGDVRCAPAGVRRRNQQGEPGRRDGRQAEGRHRAADEDLRRRRSSGGLLMIDERPGVVAVIADRHLMRGKMRVNRLAVMVSAVSGVEMHVHHRRGDCPRLHEHDERGSRHPAKHSAIVVNRWRRAPDEFLTIPSECEITRSAVLFSQP